MSMNRMLALFVLVLASFGAAFAALPHGSVPTAPVPAPAPASAPITQLTEDPVGALRPAWSPDNRLIAFESNRDGPYHLYLMNADGSQPRALTSGPNDDREPIWTPDGRSLLFISSDGTHQDIWSVNVADGTRTQLTHLDGLADFATLSPDGRTMAFYLYQDMTLNLWSARADGSEPQPLTHDLADARRNEPTLAWHQPAWGPDSQWLAFTGGDGRSIWIIRRDGTDARSVIDDGETNHFPWFLPDGRLAYVTEYDPSKYGAAWTNAWAYNLQTGKRTLLQERMAMQGPVDWSADTSKLLFSSPRNGHFDIYLIDLNVPGGLEALRGPETPAEIFVTP